MEVDGDGKRRFTNSSQKEMDVDGPKLIPFQKSRTEAFRTPAVKQMINPFTPVPKKASTFISNTVKKQDVNENVDPDSKCARET